MVVLGRSNKEIAALLSISLRTVKSYVARLLRKVGAENRILLSVHALDRRLVSSKRQWIPAEKTRRGLYLIRAKGGSCRFDFFATVRRGAIDRIGIHFRQ
jgi:regulatory LuxR family protein